MFGFRVIRQSRLEKLLELATKQGQDEIIDVVKKASKIVVDKKFKEPVKLYGDNQAIVRCMFFGNDTGVSIKGKKKE